LAIGQPRWLLIVERERPLRHPSLKEPITVLGAHIAAAWDVFAPARLLVGGGWV
jgi:hypothetical protein